MSTLEPAAQSKPPGGFKLWLSQLQMKHGRKLVIALPYIWLILLFLLPFLIVFKISLAEMARAIPPYTELMEWADGQLSITLNLGNFLQLTDDPLYFDAYLQSLQVAAISTICCLLIGYPLAWAVAHSKPSTRNILLLLVILPSWTSFLIRVYAWMGILKNNGVLNNFLLWLGCILLRTPKRASTMSALPAVSRAVSGADGVSMPGQNTAAISASRSLSPPMLTIAIIFSIPFWRCSPSKGIGTKCWSMSSCIRKTVVDSVWAER